MMKVISLGWGVQSFTLAAMVAIGELEPVDAAIHADTGHERSLTYSFADRWTNWLLLWGVNVQTVRANDTEPINRFGGVMLPAYMWNGKKRAKFDRQCTDKWKREPLRRWLQANRKRQPVELWLGISFDEFQRMRDSDVKYITHRYPLIEKRMKRSDCVAWLESHGLEVPEKSACFFCPFHDTKSWRELKLSGNGDWQKAIEVDEAIRKARPPFDLFVHPSRIPLVDVDLRNQEDRGQLSLWDGECSGMCGV